jgi:outer membrane protein
MTAKSTIIATIFGTLMTCFFAVTSYGQVPINTQSAAVRVAIVNMQDAITSTDEGKKEMSVLDQKFTPRQEELKKANDEVENLKKQLSTPEIKLTDDQRKTLASTLETKQKIFQRNFEDFQTEIQKSEQEAVNKIGEKMMQVVEKYAAAHGFTVVLDVSNPQTGIVWTSPSANITKDLIAAYNTLYPVKTTDSKKP